MIKGTYQLAPSYGKGLETDTTIISSNELLSPQNLECNPISSIGLIPLRYRDGQHRFNIFLWLDSVRGRTGLRISDGRVENCSLLARE